MPRGKKAKLKKIQEKYGEQDEEERAMRMRLIGVWFIANYLKFKSKNKIGPRHKNESCRKKDQRKR